MLVGHGEVTYGRRGDTIVLKICAHSDLYESKFLDNSQTTHTHTHTSHSTSVPVNLTSAPKGKSFHHFTIKVNFNREH